MTLQFLVVDPPTMWSAGEFMFRKFRDNREDAMFMAPDRIHDLVVERFLGSAWNPVLACQDRMLRVMEDDDPVYEIGVEGAVTGLSLYNTVSEFSFDVAPGAQAASSSSASPEDGKFVRVPCFIIIIIIVSSLSFVRLLAFLSGCPAPQALTVRL